MPGTHLWTSMKIWKRWISCVWWWRTWTMNFSYVEILRFRLLTNNTKSQKFSLWNSELNQIQWSQEILQIFLRSKKSLFSPQLFSFVRHQCFILGNISTKIWVGSVFSLILKWAIRWYETRSKKHMCGSAVWTRYEIWKIHLRNCLMSINCQCKVITILTR